MAPRCCLRALKIARSELAMRSRLPVATHPYPVISRILTCLLTDWTTLKHFYTV